MLHEWLQGRRDVSSFEVQYQISLNSHNFKFYRVGKSAVLMHHCYISVSNTAGIKVSFFISEKLFQTDWTSPISILNKTKNPFL